MNSPCANTVWVVCWAQFAMHLQRYAGGIQATWPIPTPAEAYGLLLNLCGIDSNDHTCLPALPTRRDAPSFWTAIGSISTAGRGKILTHQHIHRVGKQNIDPRGLKTSIEPAHREVLVGTQFVVGMRADKSLTDRIIPCLRGDIPAYNFLTAGTSDSLIDRVEVLDSPPEANWYAALDPKSPPRAGSHRFPVWIDRRNEGKGRSTILAPTERTSEVPGTAWVRVGPN